MSMSVEIDYRLFQLQQRPRGRPRKVVSEEERQARLQAKLEAQKRWITENPETYKLTVKKTQEKNREKINQKAREKRAILKALKMETEQHAIQIENILA